MCRHAIALGTVSFFILICVVYSLLVSQLETLGYLCHLLGTEVMLVPLWICHTWFFDLEFLYCESLVMRNILFPLQKSFLSS